MAEENLNLEYHRRRLLLIALNRYKTKTLAWKALGITKKQLYVMIDNFNVKWVNGKYITDKQSIINGKEEINQTS